MRPGGRRLIRVGQVSILWQPRAVAVGVLLLVALAVLTVILLGTGTLALSPAQIFGALTGSGDGDVASKVINRVRLPRVLTAMAVGASLGMAGAVFQSLSRNALGSPDVIGFTTGAATGALMQIILVESDPIRTAAAAVASGMLTAIVVLLLARRGAVVGGYRLILVGIGVGATLAGINTMLMVVGDIDRTMSAQVWLAGSLNGRNWGHVWTALVGFCLFAPPVLMLSRRLGVMEMGEDMARQLGVGVSRSRFWLVLASVGLTSVATATTGPIAFIALAAPQIARKLTGSSDVPLVSGALTGAVLLLVADLIGQSAPFALYMPIGLTTGLLGGVYLLLVLTQCRNA